MGSIQFLGLASGTDWNSIIDQLVQLERAPIERLMEQRDKLEFDRSVMTHVNRQLTAFSTTLSNLRFESTFLSRIVEASSRGRVSATAQPGAALGTYNIEVGRLAAPSRATSGLDGEIYSKVANLSLSQTIGIQRLLPYDRFQPTRALASTLIKDTLQAGQAGARITAGDTVEITGTLKDGVTNVSGTFTFAGDETDMLERLATAVAQVFRGEIAASVGSNGELVFIETDPSAPGDVSLNTTVPPLDLQFRDSDYSGSTLSFGIGNQIAGGGATQRRLIHGVPFTTGGVLETNDGTDLAALDQATGTLDNGDIIRITGQESDGTAIAPADFTYTGAAGGQTIADLISEISSAFASATATFENGRIVLTADAGGTSSLDLALEFIDQGSPTEFELGGFVIGEPGRAATAQMITTSGFTVEGTGEHLLSSTTGKAGKIRGTLTLPDPSNTLASFGVTEFDMLAIDPDGTAGPLLPISITGLSEYSTLQDLVDAINLQVPTATAQLVDNGSSYFFEVVGNRGGQNLRVYDDSNGVLQILGPGNPTDIDTAAGDPYSGAATTDDDDATLVAWFQPNVGGPLQRRVWAGDEGAPVQGLIGGVAIDGTGGNFNPGVATVVTANSAELNTRQDMRTYLFGDAAVVEEPPTHYPPFDPARTLAEAGFAVKPQNSSDDPTFHTDGFFTVNGVRINVGDVNTMTVNELLGQINASGAGVTAFFDTAVGRFYLRNNSLGPQNITLGGGGDTSNFLAIARLLPAQGGVLIAGQQRGALDTELPLAQAGFSQSVTSGVFTVNGVRITIDSGVDTLTDVITKVGNSGAGVVASYDPVADQLTLSQDLSSDPSGHRINIGDPADTSNFLEAVQLAVDTTTPAQIGTVRQTAEFSVNGVHYTRTSNAVGDVLDEVTLALNAITDGPETITVSSDTDRIQSAIVDFIVDYNTTMELINGKPLTKEERAYTAVLTEEKAANMTIQQIEDYLQRREELLIRDFVARDNTARQMSRKIISLVQGQVRNDGLYQSLAQLGITTAEVGGGPEAAAVSQGRLLAPTGEREIIEELVSNNGELQDAVNSNSDELFTLFANLLESRYTHQGSRDLSDGITVGNRLSFNLGDGRNTAAIAFAAGSHSQNVVLNTINRQLLSSGLSSTMLAYFDTSSQLNLRMTNTTGQAYLQVQDTSLGSDSLLGILGIQPGNFPGPDPMISGGVARRTRSYVTDITGVGGIVMERIKQNGSFDRRIAIYNDAIRAQEERLAQYEYRLRKKFERLETNLIALQSQSLAIEQAITNMQSQTGGGQQGG